MNQLRTSVISIVGASAGAFFETFDLFVYTALISSISTVFLSNLPVNTANTIVFLIFGLGFLSRPLGGLLFGHVGDKWGRKKAFIATVIIMGLATFFIGLLPGYDQIGVLAPILLAVLRAFQGVAFGGEAPGIFVFVYEHAPANRRGLLVSLSQIMGIVGLLFGYVVVAISEKIAGNQFNVWGWRIPFLLGVVFLIFLLVFRLTMKESPVFTNLQKEKEICAAPLLEIFGKKSYCFKMAVGLFGICSAGGIACTMGFFFPIIFLTTFTTMDKLQALQLVLIAMSIGIPFTALAGWLADKIGPRIVMYVSCIACIVVYFPAYKTISFLAKSPKVDSDKLLAILVLLSILGSLINGIYPSLMAANFPAKVRYSAMSFPYNISGVFFIGFLPAIFSAINTVTGEPLAGLIYPIAVLFFAVVIAAFFVRPEKMVLSI